MSNSSGLTDSELSLKKTIRHAFSKEHNEVENLKVRKLSMKVSDIDYDKRVQKLTLGNPSHRQTKVILMIGATGSGKSTLINAIVNYIYRIEFQDDFRLILVDDKNAPKKSVSESQTDMITAYQFNYMPGMPFEYNYILIDTPGFGDTGGIERDFKLMDQLKHFLMQDYGVDQVDGIGFVAASTDARLTQTQQYVFDGLLSMFGRNIKDNIFIMATFADNCVPPVLAALKDGGVPYTSVFKFNNSSIYASNVDDILSQMYWQVGQKNIGNFFRKLGKIYPVSMVLTRDVLEERMKLQKIVTGLNNQIQIGLAKLSNLHKERDMLIKASDDVEGCKDFEVEVDVYKTEKVHLPSTVIIKESPFYGIRANIFGLRLALGVSGNASDHIVKENFRYETSSTKEKRTVQELHDRYKVAVKGKEAVQLTISKIEKEIKNFGNFLVTVIRDAERHISRLDDIALKPNPLNAADYIDLLIGSEKMQKNPDFLRKIEMLEMLKKQQSLLSGVREAVSIADEGGEQLLELFQKMIIK